MKVQAAVAKSAKSRLEIETVTLSGVGDNDVLIENKAAGLCHSDLRAMDGKWGALFPLIPGHEGAGIVVEVGKDVVGIKPGDHVVTCGIGECGHCAHCRSELTNLCEAGGVPGLMKSLSYSEHFKFESEPVAVVSEGAAFATHSIVNQMYATPVPKSLPFDTACLLGCCVLTGVGSTEHVVKVKPGSSVIVIGLGGIGLNVIDGARLAGAERIIGVDINPAKDAAGRLFGMTDFVNSANLEEAAAQIRDLTGGGADCAFECVGAPALAEMAIQATRQEWGQVALVGMLSGPVTVEPLALAFGRVVTGGFFGKAKPRTELARLAKLLADGKLNSDKLVSHTMPLNEINKAVELIESGETIRSVVIH